MLYGLYHLTNIVECTLRRAVIVAALFLCVYITRKPFCFLSISCWNNRSLSRIVCAYVNSHFFKIIFPIYDIYIHVTKLTVYFMKVVNLKSSHAECFQCIGNCSCVFRLMLIRTSEIRLHALLYLYGPYTVAQIVFFSPALLLAHLYIKKVFIEQCRKANS